MSGCHVPLNESGNTHPCIGCGLSVDECQCIWNKFRESYLMVSALSNNLYEKADKHLVSAHYIELSARIEKLEDFVSRLEEWKRK